MACDGTDICPLAIDEEDLDELARALHTSRSSVGLFVLPYFIRVMINEKINPAEFALDNSQDESVGESIAKEMEKVKKRK